MRTRTTILIGALLLASSALAGAQNAGETPSVATTAQAAAQTPPAACAVVATDGVSPAF